MGAVSDIFKSVKERGPTEVVVGAANRLSGAVV
jgi:hypothetical protein